LWCKLGPKGYLKTLLLARDASLHLIDMLEQQVNDAFSLSGVYELDEIIADFQHGYAADQADDTASDDGLEETAPSSWLSDDISLLDGAILMIDELISPAGKAWNDRHTVHDIPAPPLQDPTAWLGIITLPGALFSNVSASTNFSGTLAHYLSAKSSKTDVNNGCLPWDDIFNDEWQRPLHSELM
jgi:hypothetical protein